MTHSASGLVAAILERRQGPKPNLVEGWTDTAAANFGQRALDVAIEAAQLAEAQLPPPREEWKDIATAAVEADQALGRLLAAMDPIGKNSEAAIAHVLGQIRLPEEPCQLKALITGAHQDARRILAVRSLIRQMGADATQRRRTFPIRQQPGKPGPAAFAVILGEAWVCLFREGPKATRAAGQNPFIDFVRAGWSDWKGGVEDDEQFQGGLIAARKNLTAEKIEYLKWTLPGWA